MNFGGLQHSQERADLPAQKIAAGRFSGDIQGTAPHGGAEPLDQPRFPNDQPVAVRRPSRRAIAAD